jgi:hypothetical protein
MRPNRPHISSSIQISKSKDTKQTPHPNFGRSCLSASSFPQALPDPRRQPQPHRCNRSSPVTPYLGKPTKTRKTQKDRSVNFLQKF